MEDSGGSSRQTVAGGSGAAACASDCAGANDEKAQKVSPEAVIPGRTGKASWRRIPAALTSGFRVIAFRVSVPLGVGSASIAELFFIWSYMATILAFTFVNSEYNVASLRTRG